MRLTVVLLLVACLLGTALASFSNPTRRAALPVPAPVPAAHVPPVPAHPAPPARAHLSGFQIAVLVLSIFIVFLAIFGVFIPVPMAQYSVHDRLSLSRYEHTLAQANGGQHPGVSGHAALLEFRAWQDTIQVHRMADLKGRYPAESFLKNAGHRMAWRSTDRETGQQVVVKIQMSKRNAAEIENELKAMRKIAQHPHPGLKPAKAIYYGEDPTSIVSEWIPGVTWASLQDLTFEENMLILLECAQALDHLHSVVGITHGDLHYQNIMVDEKGKPILIDFSRSTKSKLARQYTNDVQTLLFMAYVKLTNSELSEPASVDKLNTPLWFKDLFQRVLKGDLKYASGLVSELTKHSSLARRHRKTLAAKVVKASKE